MTRIAEAREVDAVGDRLHQRPASSYTVMVWRYIMFCANTRPVPVASTDFGEMSPVMVLTSRSGRSTAVSSGGRGRRRDRRTGRRAAAGGGRGPRPRVRGHGRSCSRIVIPSDQEHDRQPPKRPRAPRRHSSLLRAPGAAPRRFSRSGSSPGGALRHNCLKTN